MTRLLRLFCLLALLGGALAVLPRSAAAHALGNLPRSATAHPMGNFTINQYSALTVGADQVAVLYVLDMAEIPTYQELGTIRPDHSYQLTPAEREAYLVRKPVELLKGLALTVDGRALPLAVAAPAELSLPLGAGDLPTLRLVLHLSAPLAGVMAGSLEYHDSNYSDRMGWKEVIARAADGTALQDATVPDHDQSVALSQYRSDLITNPPLVTSATLRFAPGAGVGTGAATQAVPQDATSWVQARSDALTALISQKELPLGALLLGLVIAFGFGAAHALSPGHGKAIVAAYLVGSRGTAIHAAFLGLVVTVSHTIAVFLLGLIVLYASEYILPEKIYPWLGFASGAAVALVGGVLFFQRRRTWLRARFASAGLVQSAGHTHDHDHGHDHDHAHEHGHSHAHDHDHAHDHEHDHAPGHAHQADYSHDPHTHAAPELHRHGPFGRPHSHVPAAGQAVTVRSMLALGITGGIIPCPSALVVLLAAIAYQKVGLGLLLILAFSLGLALVLTGIGLVMVYGRGLLDRVRLPVSGGLLARLPMFSALAVACLGVLLAVQSLTSGGVLR